MSYPSNPTDPKYNMGGRYLTEYMNFSNFSIKLLKSPNTPNAYNIIKNATFTEESTSY